MHCTLKACVASHRRLSASVSSLKRVSPLGVQHRVSRDAAGAEEALVHALYFALKPSLSPHQSPHTEHSPRADFQ